ncbi:MAG: hypothetical protein JRE28_10975 [Deltaproteobacteria bacterium]|nr:hypothetical protein [Deltaproteobacteria bacterium]
MATHEEETHKKFIDLERYGYQKQRRDHVKKAATHFDNVLRINPDDIGARRNLERALLMLRKADETNGIEKQR